LDLREGKPSVLFDGAHNAAGARALHDYLDEFIKVPITLVFGAMRDKDLSSIAATLFPIADKLILTQPSNTRAATLEALASFVPSNFDSGRITLASTPGEALRVAYEQTPPNGLICITGSLYLVGEVLSISDFGIGISD
jgi:dihydrofolate synthase/folylpolyglutamate synthase